MTDLHDLLEQRARQGSVHPSMEGVNHAIGRRKAQRRQRRAIGGGIAAVCLLAGVAGGVALTTGDDTVEQPMTTEGLPSSVLPEVPAVGLEIDGLEDAQVETGILDRQGEPGRTVAVFRSGGSLADAYLSLAIEPPVDGVESEVRGDPIDLDGDGTADGGIGGNEAGLNVAWRLDDGSLAIVGAESETSTSSESAAVAYAEEVFGPTIDLGAVPAPEGLPERTIFTYPDRRGPGQARVTLGSVTVTTTNQLGWFDVLQGVTPFCCGAGPYDEVTLGDSFLGSGRAIVRDGSETGNEEGSYALIRTDAGLTVEVDAPGIPVEDLRALIEAGALVDVPV